MAKKTKIKPLYDYLLIEPKQSESTTPSGIVIPDTADKEKPQEGVVLATGKGRLDKDGKTLPLAVEVGNTVMYKKWGGTEVKVDNKEYLLIKEEDILAIVEA